VLRALRFGTGDLNPHFFIWPGTLLLYFAFASYADLFVVGPVLGWWVGKEGFAAACFSDPTAFYLLPGIESVAFGVWTVWLAWGIGRAGWGTPVGIAAALGWRSMRCARTTPISHIRATAAATAWFLDTANHALLVCAPIASPLPDR
jgi:hypothetical protein